MIFTPPVSFPVLVEGKKLKAFVLEEIDNPIDTIFRVAFSDGFEDFRFAVWHTRVHKGQATVAFEDDKRVDRAKRNLINRIGNAFDWHNIFFFNMIDIYDVETRCIASLPTN